MSTPDSDPLDQLRQTFAAAVQAQPALNRLVVAALSDALPDLLGQPDRVIVDLFVQEESSGTQYGLHVFDADNPPETDGPYAQIPLLTMGSENNPKSLVIDGTANNRVYGTATPELEQACSSKLECQQVAMSFWRARRVYTLGARRLGADFYTGNNRLSMAGPGNKYGVSDVSAILSALDEDS